jgi:hypothetical protein
VIEHRLTEGDCRDRSDDAEGYHDGRRPQDRNAWRRSKANSVVAPLIAVVTNLPQSLSPTRAVTSRDDKTRMRRRP